MRTIARLAGWALLTTLTVAGPVSASAQTLVQTAVSLGAGRYAWGGAVPAKGPVAIVVSIPLQQLFVYRGPALVAVSAVSTGSRGHETPAGAFTILQKDVDHKSNKYSDAPMPYMQRLTWDGIAIHGGRDPGYPVSHGCIRVPLAFARRLYAITSLGARVAVIDGASVPGLPVDYATDLAAAKATARAALIDPETDATRAANLATAVAPPADQPAVAPAPVPAAPVPAAAGEVSVPAPAPPGS